MTGSINKHRRDYKQNQVQANNLDLSKIWRSSSGLTFL